ncbi:hypothetical protein [Leptolyngbya sp. 7M]|uniref:hypothetical protein n=1 Tax=Leptolyngbya sp. 7M TaxID=2812896 RepID=UPI001B8B647A|nr:hypothetical protein [Leptolyngbya sp. 7M]QYO67943.1 hypothetical protein JVX88_14875 [Leptolyngbya sp. 7M]
MKFSLAARLILLIITFTAAISAQNRFEGYSFVLEADESGVCPVRYLPGASGGNSVEVFIAGTGQRQNAAGLTACDGAGANANNVLTNGVGKWCFQGPEPMYEIRLKNGDTYLWYPTTKESGFFNVKDFRPVTRSGSEYVFTEPADHTATIRNALYFIASRQGGTLRFPEGDYIVGTLDGNRRDPRFRALTLPSGVVIEGASARISTPSTLLPNNKSASRIRLRNDNQAIFRIGGCTSNITIQNLELVGNEALQAEAQRSVANTYAIEGFGKWSIDPATRAQLTNTSMVFKFSNLTIQGFDRGIYVHNAGGDNCNPSLQACGEWQFDHLKVEHIFL